MVQGKKAKRTQKGNNIYAHKAESNKKNKVVAPKQRKIENLDEKEKMKEVDLHKTMHRKADHMQKKIYRSIEQTIVDNAKKKNRERFNIL